VRPGRPGSSGCRRTPELAGPAAAGRGGDRCGPGRAARLLEAALDILLPEGGCVVCGGPLPPASTWEPEACPGCLGDIFRRGAAAARRPLSSPSAAFLDGVVSGGLYTGVLERAVLRLKRRPDSKLARFLARLMAERLAEEEVWATPAFIVPVPLHPSRLAERGFNQAELLARELGRFLGCPVARDLCVRVRWTPLQSSLGREERSKALRGAFRLRRRASAAATPGPGPGRESRAAPAAVVVDDVVTTGATCGEVARTLKAAGVGRVVCVAVARAE